MLSLRRKEDVMDKVKQFAQKYPVLYCIAVEILFLVILTGIGFGLGAIVKEGNYYVLLFIQEAIGALLAYGLLRLTGLQKVVKNKGCGFGRGLLVGLYLLVISVYTLVVMTAMYEGDRTLQPWYLIAVFIGCMACVGITEEFTFRGVMATLLLKKFGTDKKGVWKAVAVSGGLFGLAHISNIMGCSPLGVIVQAVIASMLGMVLAAIYFRTGCIWVTVFIHAFIDVAAAFTTGIYGNETMADTISSYSLVNLVSCVPYLIVLLVLLRKKKIGEVEENMGKLVESL